MVDNVETVYVWTSGTEEIKDFSVMNGLFTFTKSAEKAVCTMTNAMLPKLSLTTVPVDITVEGSAVEEIEATDNCEAEYFNLQGVKVSGNETRNLYPPSRQQDFKSHSEIRACLKSIQGGCVKIDRI